MISAIERVSRPGCRVYVGQTEIPRVLGGMGINILTTPRGVMTGRDAHKERLTVQGKELRTTALILRQVRQTYAPKRQALWQSYS